MKTGTKQSFKSRGEIVMRVEMCNPQRPVVLLLTTVSPVHSVPPSASAPSASAPVHAIKGIEEASRGKVATRTPSQLHF